MTRYYTVYYSSIPHCQDLCLPKLCLKLFEIGAIIHNPAHPLFSSAPAKYPSRSPSMLTPTRSLAAAASAAATVENFASASWSQSTRTGHNWQQPGNWQQHTSLPFLTMFLLKRRISEWLATLVSKWFPNLPGRIICASLEYITLTRTCGRVK